MARQIRYTIQQAYSFACNYPTFYVCVFLADIPYWVVQSTIPEDDEKLIYCFKGEKIMKKGGDNYDESLKSVY